MGTDLSMLFANRQGGRRSSRLGRISWRPALALQSRGKHTLSAADAGAAFFVKVGVAPGDPVSPAAVAGLDDQSWRDAGFDRSLTADSPVSEFKPDPAARRGPLPCVEQRLRCRVTWAEFNRLRAGSCRHRDIGPTGTSSY